MRSKIYIFISGGKRKANALLTFSRSFNLVSTSYNFSSLVLKFLILCVWKLRKIKAYGFNFPIDTDFGNVL